MKADLKAALDEFNRGVIRARNAYRMEHSPGYRDWLWRIKRAAKDQRRAERRRSK